MLITGRQNPFLSKDETRKHVSCFFSNREDPLMALTPEQRVSAVKMLGTDSKKSFGKTSKAIKKTLLRFNPLQVLAHFGYYDTLVHGQSREKGGYEPIQQASLEWLQALVLLIPEKHLQTIMGIAPPTKSLTLLNQQLREACMAYGTKPLAKGLFTDEDMAVELIRQHTAFIRNEGFPSQILRCQQELFAPLDKVFFEKEGFKLTDLVSLLWGLVDAIQKKINDDLLVRQKILGESTAERVLLEFQAVTGNTPEGVRKQVGKHADDLTKVRNVVINWLDLRNFRFFYFNFQEIQALLPPGLPPEKAREIMGKLSISWGSLGVMDAEGMILENPVWTKPLIAVGNDNFFMPIPSLVQSFGLEMIEGFLKGIHPELYLDYKRDTRAEFLERRTEEAVRKAFPHAKVFRNLKFGTPSVAGNEGENDVLALLDSQAFVFECKSGQARLPAKHGSLDELREAGEKLIGSPSSQGKKFADFLLSNRKVINLKDTDGEVWELDLRNLLEVTAVNVHLDYFGPLTTKHSLLKKVGLIKPDSVPTATMPLHDLETVLELLDRPALALHYLKRRAELESANDVIGSELDLLATYLGTSFDFGEIEGDGKTKICFPEMSSQLNAFFMGREVGTPTCKPRLRLTDWWQNCLDAFERRNFHGWLQASYALLCVRFEGQENYETMVKDFRAGMSRRFVPGENDTCVLITGPVGSRTAVATLCFWDESREEVRLKVSARIGEIAEEHGVKRVLLLVLPAEDVTEPYFGAYFWTPEIEKVQFSVGIPLKGN